MADEGRHRVYGTHAIETLLARRPEAIVEVIMLDSARDKRLAGLRRDMEARGIAIRRASRGELDRYADGGRHQGVVAMTRGRPAFSIADLEALVSDRGQALRLLLLDQVEDPRNLGACLRTAAAASADAVVVPKSGSAKLTPAAQKAAAGLAETMPLIVVPNLARAMAWLRKAGVWILGFDGQADKCLYQARLETPVALVFGGEGRGLRRLTRESCDEVLKIPMNSDVESLNVSVAAGVALFELRRQCKPEAKP